MQEAQAPLPAGTVIQEHYIVESLLGKGDFGNVYLVRDQRDEQKLFALAELINPAEGEKYRFALEYVSLAPLDHRALPHVQYVFNDDKLSRAYVLMRYIEETNLEILRLQQPEKRFPSPQVMAIMTPVINAVAYLHGRHPPVFHRNIKPASIIVSRTVDAPVLAMLDICKEHDSTTTPLHYFAPGYGATEQYSGKFSTRTDIYGLGATWYTLLTGIVPPDALYRSTQLSNGEIDPLKPIHEVMPDIPTLIAEAIQRAMSIDANDRFSSVEHFREVLASPVGQSWLELSRSMTSTSPPLSAPAPEQPAALHPGELDGLGPAASRQADEKPVPAPVPEQHSDESAGVEFSADDEKPVPAPAPEQPRTARASEPGNLEPAASRQKVETPAPASMPEQPRAPRVWKPGVPLIVLALLISLGTGAGFWFHARSLSPAHTATPTPFVMRPSPTPTATPVPSIYPTLTGTYSGTIYDVSANVSTNMSLTGIRQNQANISGYLALGPNIQGSGPFSGTIDTTKQFQFIVTDGAGNTRLFFEGVMQSSTSLTGNYYSCSPVGPVQGGRCSQAPGSYGIWNVILA